MKKKTKKIETSDKPKSRAGRPSGWGFKGIENLKGIENYDAFNKGYFGAQTIDAIYLFRKIVMANCYEQKGNSDNEMQLKADIGRVIVSAYGNGDGTVLKEVGQMINQFSPNSKNKSKLKPDQIKLFVIQLCHGLYDYKAGFKFEFKFVENTTGEKIRVATVESIRDAVSRYIAQASPEEKLQLPDDVSLRRWWRIAGGEIEKGKVGRR